MDLQRKFCCTLNYFVYLHLSYYYSRYFIIFRLFVLNCFADAEPIKYDERIKVLKNPCPQIQASFLSKLTYFWATPLLWKGFRQPLTQDVGTFFMIICAGGVQKLRGKTLDFFNPPLWWIIMLKKSY